MRERKKLPLPEAFKQIIDSLMEPNARWRLVNRKPFTLRKTYVVSPKFPTVKNNILLLLEKAFGKNRQEFIAYWPGSLSIDKKTGFFELTARRLTGGRFLKMIQRSIEEGEHEIEEGGTK